MNNVRWNLNEEDFQRALTGVKNNLINGGLDYIGSFEVGALSIEFILRCYDDNIQLDYDVYVGGIDEGYGYTESNKPYDFCEGGMMIDKNNINVFLNFEVFKKLALKEINNYIQNSKYNVVLIEKSEEEFFDWN